MARRKTTAAPTPASDPRGPGVYMIVLGAGAGGGLPQWNCCCDQCLAARAGQIAPMTQSSVAASVGGRDWVLLNASPDLRQQLAATPALHPTGLRGSPLKAVVLTNGDVDHIAGLLTLREKTPFTLYATQATLDVLAANSVFAVLDASLVQKVAIRLDQPFAPLPGLTLTAHAVPGKVPLYLEGEALDLQMLGEQTIGLTLETASARAEYIPGCADLPPALLARLTRADLLLFDGTVWQDDEMPRSGTGAKTGARMGHLSMQTSMARLASLTNRRLFTHINNTNPALLPETPVRAAVLAAGWALAHDGMEITL